MSGPSARSITRHLTWVFVIGGMYFLARGSLIILDALEVAAARWARGEPVDWQGIAAMVMAVGSAAGVILPIFIQLLRDRRIQRVEEIRAGRPPAPGPFPQSPPSSGAVSPVSPPDSSPTPNGGLVNNEALQ